MSYMVTATWWPQRLYQDNRPNPRRTRPAEQTTVVPDRESAERMALFLVEARGATYSTFEEIPEEPKWQPTP